MLVKKTATGEEIEIIPAGTFFSVLCSGGKVQVVTVDGPQGPFDYVELQPVRTGDDPGEGRVAIQMKTELQDVRIPGVLGEDTVRPGSGADDLWVYNFVPVDKYVRDIGEVDLDWAMPSASGYAPEAVKAQAVAARTYALAKNGTLTDGWQDQYYARLPAGGQVPRSCPGGRGDGRAHPHVSGEARIHVLLGPLRRLHHRLGLVGGRLRQGLHRRPARPLEPESPAFERQFRRPWLELDLYHLALDPLRQSQQQSQGRHTRRRSTWA